MRSKIFLIAIVIFLVCLLLEQLKRTKKEGLDKLSIGGLSVAIIGVVIVLISSIFMQKKSKNRIIRINTGILSNMKQKIKEFYH